MPRGRPPKPTALHIAQDAWRGPAKSQPWSDASVCRSTALPWRGGHASTPSHPGRWATDSQPTAHPAQIVLGATRARVTA